MEKAALLDTSFFLRLLNENDPLCKNAEGYYRYFLEKEIPMMISTIATGEFCVKGNLDELPMKDLQILPYNLSHSLVAGNFAKILFYQRNSGNLDVNRVIIPNDVKMFAQADREDKIGYYVTSDRASGDMISYLLKELKLNFSFINIETGYSEYFGILDL